MDNYERFLPYADIQDGLGRILNNKKLYSKLIVRFKDDDNMKKTADAVNAGDITNALMYVHTLKGVAANLSLKAVHQGSIALEADMKQNAGNQAELLQKLQQDYDRTMGILDDVIAALEA